MSPAPAVAAGNARLVATYRHDQRSHQRYPIVLDVDYRLVQRGRVERQGSGRTLNVASAGLLLETETNESLPLGCAIELVLNWPFLLEGVCPLKLVMRGRIVRSDARGVAVQAKHHEFRTAGARVARKTLPHARMPSLAG